MIADLRRENAELQAKVDTVERILIHETGDDTSKRYALTARQIEFAATVWLKVYHSREEVVAVLWAELDSMLPRPIEAKGKPTKEGEA